jgi:hypothetical protein
LTAWTVRRIEWAFRVRPARVGLKAADSAAG